jgi:hypothetical protein
LLAVLPAQPASAKMSSPAPKTTIRFMLISC